MCLPLMCINILHPSQEMTNAPNSLQIELLMKKKTKVGVNKMVIKNLSPLNLKSAALVIACHINEYLALEELVV